MNTPKWANPKNWSEETKEAAKDVLKTAALFVVTVLMSNSKAGRQLADTIKNLPI